MKTFLMYIIVPIRVNDIAKHGGLMNCISWIL